MSSSASRNFPSFDPKAARYDELRPVDERWWKAFDEIVRLGDLRGRRVVEIGCGTGQLAHALEERAYARVWAVDASPEMVARAKERGVNARVARAEALPFKQGWFERAVLRVVAHLLDRPQTFAELGRVLRPDGRLIVATADPASFELHWLTPYFPSLGDVERARFPTEELLRAELEDAGFSPVSFSRLSLERTMTRELAVEAIRAKIYSTFDLLPPDEYAAGLSRAEATLPESFPHRFDWLFAVAER
jgi:ubiquinone/menaquinone biosynthesis C-methylase UbiE